VAAEGLSVRQVEELARTYAHRVAQEPPGSAPAGRDPRTAEVEEVLADKLGTRVRVQMGRRKGKIVVEFGSRKDLDRIVATIVG
jgi:ParB family chromosome partitioning protein